MRKAGGPRTLLVHPTRPNISADGNLASKLAQLAGEADSIKQKMTDGLNCTARKTPSAFKKSSSVDCDPPQSLTDSTSKQTALSNRR